jgi:hypothetical protein
MIHRGNRKYGSFHFILRNQNYMQRLSQDFKVTQSDGKPFGKIRLCQNKKYLLETFYVTMIKGDHSQI